VRKRAVPRRLPLIGGLPEHPLLDRIVRGRGWIPILGVMLAGIVAMQVEVLKLNASIGRSLALSATLQSRNDSLRATVAALSDAKRIEGLATKMGMVMPGPTSVDFVTAGQASAGGAAAGIHTPDQAMFTSALQASALQASVGTSPAVRVTPTTPGGGTTTPAAAAPATTTGTATASTGPTQTVQTAGAPTTALTPTATAPTATTATGTTGGAAP